MKTKLNISDINPLEVKVFYNKHQRRIALLRKYSRAENHFKKLLIKAGIFFHREKIQETKYKTYYTDFYIVDLKLNIEIDGKEHLEKKDYDLDKENRIYAIDKTLTIRFTNEEVLLMKSISASEFKNRLDAKYDVLIQEQLNTITSCIIDPVIANKRLKKKNEKEKHLLKLESEKKDKFDSLVLDSFKENDLTIFIDGKCEDLKVSKMNLCFDIYDNSELMESFNIETTEHTGVSAIKADILCVIKALEYIISESGERLNIRIFSHKTFVVNKLNSDFRFKDSPNAIYNDVMKEVNNLIDVCPNLTFSYLPKQSKP